jgi:hypothetical protein
MKPDLVRQLHNRSGRLDAPRAWLDHDDELVDGAGRAAPQVFDPRFHIDNHNLISVKDNLAEEAAEEDIFRTGVATAPSSDRPQDQKFDPPKSDGLSVGNIADRRVQLEQLAELAGARARALLDQWRFSEMGIIREAWFFGMPRAEARFASGSAFHRQHPKPIPLKEVSHNSGRSGFPRSSLA